MFLLYFAEMTSDSEDLDFSHGEEDATSVMSSPCTSFLFKNGDEQADVDESDTEQADVDESDTEQANVDESDTE
jgi:hypothetical protein